MTFSEAIAQGIRRVRDPQWAHPNDYMLIDILEGGKCGPWVHLYSQVQPLIGAPTPQDVPIFAINGREDKNCCEPYTGEIHPADTAPR